jgi:N utilization substance protein A
MNVTEFTKALDVLEKERGIPKEVVLESLKEALEKAYKKNYNTHADVEVNIDVEGNLKLLELKEVVDKIDEANADKEILLAEAQQFDSAIQVGDTLKKEVNVEEFGRLAAVLAKQVVRQKIREIEKTLVYDSIVDKKDEVMVGTIERVEPSFAIIDLGLTGGILQQKEQIPNERLRIGERLKVYVLEVDKSARGAQVSLSRASNNFLKRLFEEEVPDIMNGDIIIKSIAREPGDRSKMAVYATKEGLDPIGACIGPKGIRVQRVSNELLNEKIDIIEYHKDVVKFINAALAPAKTLSVNYDEENKEAVVIVKDDQLSLAIGKKGQNVRLAVLLTQVKIDIKAESDALENNLNILNNGSAFDEDEEEKVTFREKPIRKEPKPIKEKTKAVKKVAPTIKDKPKVSYQNNEDDDIESKPVVDIDTLLQDIREATPTKKVKIKKEFVKEDHSSDEEEITFLDVEKPKEEEVVVPMYTEEELAAIRAEEEAEKEAEQEFYEEIDYDEFDKYYDE